MSIHSTIPPDAERLEALIGEAYAALPAPDAWKLKDIEERLSRQLKQPRQRKKPSVWAWWLAGALIAGSAAAWWAYQSSRESAPPPQSVPIMRDEVPAPGAVSAERDGGEGEEGEEGDATDRRPQSGEGQPARSPVIFQRESY